MIPKLIYDIDENRLNEFELKKKISNKNSLKTNIGLKSRNFTKTNSTDAALLLSNTLFNLSASYNSSISLNNSNINKQIDELNIFISQINTTQDVNKAINIKNQIITLIDNNTTKFTNISNTLDTINVLLVVTKTLLTVLNNIPLPVPISITSKLNLINRIIDGLLLFVLSFEFIRMLMNDLEADKKRINDIGLLLNKNKDNLNLEELHNFNNGNNNINNDYTEEYKGFILKIKILEDLGIGIIKKGAYALDSNKNIVIRSIPSYTSQPQQLIEEVKLIIDKGNLKP